MNEAVSALQDRLRGINASLGNTAANIKHHEEAIAKEKERQSELNGSKGFLLAAIELLAEQESEAA